MKLEYLQIYMTKELKAWVKEQALKEKRTMSNWIVTQLDKIKNSGDNVTEA